MDTERLEMLGNHAWFYLDDARKAIQKKDEKALTEQLRRLAQTVALMQQSLAASK